MVINMKDYLFLSKQHPQGYYLMFLYATYNPLFSCHFYTHVLNRDIKLLYTQISHFLFINISYNPSKYSLYGN